MPRQDLSLWRRRRRQVIKRPIAGRFGFRDPQSAAPHCGQRFAAAALPCFGASLTNAQPPASSRNCALCESFRSIRAGARLAELCRLRGVIEHVAGAIDGRGGVGREASP